MHSRIQTVTAQRWVSTCCELCTQVSLQQPVQARYNKELLVQEVVTQVGQLFLQPVASAAAPLLVQQACEDLSSGELMFSPLPGQERSQEAEAWQVKLLSLLVLGMLQFVQSIYFSGTQASTSQAYTTLPMQSHHCLLNGEYVNLCDSIPASTDPHTSQ